MPHSGAALWLGLRTVRNLRKGLTWAWLDTVCQYRRSKIGPLWETINVLVMTLGIALVSSAVIGGTVTDLIGYVGLGIIVWTAITSLISEGTRAGRVAARRKSTSVPASFPACQAWNSSASSTPSASAGL